MYELEQYFPTALSFSSLEVFLLWFVSSGRIPTLEVKLREWFGVLHHELDFFQVPGQLEPHRVWQEEEEDPSGDDQ